MIKRYVAKEVTCPTCKGHGFVEDDFDMLVYDDPEYKCPQCKGRGYIIDEKDLVTGYRVISIEEMEEEI